MTTGYRDLCIETLADSEAVLKHRVASLEADVLVYRDIVQVLLARAHDQLRRLNVQDARLHDLQLQIRQLRGRTTA